MKNTAVILIGFQNDYFSEEGILTDVVKESLEELDVLNNTMRMLKSLPENVKVISTPIIFSDDYSELIDPVGILEVIKNVKAFKKGSEGAETIDELKDMGDRITHIPGKHGLNAFTGTGLMDFLVENKIDTIVLAGCVCSICIDSTGRSAFDQGLDVIMLSDCITGRTMFEQKFYCDEIFPLYSKVINSKEFITSPDEV